MRSARPLRSALIAAAIALCGAARAADAPPLRWCEPVEIATGRAERGPWQQNESRYDYVDDPSVALDAAGRAYVTWVDQARKDVLFRSYSKDGKAMPARAVNVSRSPSVFSWLPRIALSPERPRDVYVLWQEIVFPRGSSHGGDILFSRSVDGGSSFDRTINLSQSLAGDGKGRINRDVWHNGSLDLAVASDGTLYAAWTEYEGALWITASSTAGASFSEPRRVAGDGSAPARAPSIAAGRDGAVYLAWTVGEDPAADVRIARSGDRGRTFAAPRVVERSAGYSDAPKIALDADGTIHLAWAESAGGPFDRYHVRYARSRDGGASFETSRELSRPMPAGYSGAGFPSLSLGAGRDVYVTWELYDGERPRGLALARSGDGGERFSTPAVVPSSIDARGGSTGGLQGLLMRKLAVNGAGDVAIVNSSFKAGVESRVWLTRAAGAGRDCAAPAGPRRSH